MFQRNPQSRSRQNVARHYDLTDDLYGLFLDADRNYSCAYFTSPGQSLEEAQRAKQRHIAAKVDVFRAAPLMATRDAAQLIADDDLDILFELGGTTAMNKLGVMAYRPAPLQARSC